MIKAQVITIGASYEAQVSLLTRLGTHGDIEVIDEHSCEMADVLVVLIGLNWSAVRFEQCTSQAITACRLARRGDVPLCVVRERGDWYETLKLDQSEQAVALCHFVAAPLDSERLAERIVDAARKQPATEAPDVAALRTAAAGLRKAADELATLCRGLEKAPTPSIEAHSDRLAAIRNIEAMLRVQATIADDDAAHLRIEIGLASLNEEVEMPAHVAASVDRTIREALARGE